MTSPFPPPSLAAQVGETHHWIAAPSRSWDMCAKCGTIRRSDGKNKPCEGPVPILPRAEEEK